MHPTCWEIATLFEPQLTEPGQVDGLLVDVDGTGEPKTAQALALGFKLGVADLAFPLARSLQLAAAKEPGEGVLQVTQGFLRSGFAAFVHPGKVRLLECVEFAMEFHRGNGASRLLVDLLLAGKTPIIGEPADARMLLAERDLLVIQVEFRSVAPRDLHMLFSTQSALQNLSFRASGMRKVLCDSPANKKTCIVPQPPFKS